MQTTPRPAPKRAFQLKVTLRDTSPPIWRRILVQDNLTFWDLHVAIQDAMGWSDAHLHRFEARDPRTLERILIGVPSDEDAFPVRAGWEVAVRPKLTRSTPKLAYTYDFGDGWDHRVVLEKTLPLDSGPYPRCIAGRMRCPPEDCGGVPGYERLLDVLADPSDPEHEELLEWAGGPIDPRRFDPKGVSFGDPDAALQFALESFE